MTEEENHKEQFLKYMRQLEELGMLTKPDSRSAIKDSKAKKLRELSYETLLEYKAELEASGYDLRNLTPDSLEDEGNLYQLGLKMRQTKADEHSANILVNNLEALLENTDKKKLEEIALAKPIRENAGKLSAEYEEVLESYERYMQINSVIDKYKNGEDLSDKEKPILYMAMTQTASEKIKEKLKKEGFSKEMQKLGTNIAVLAAQEGFLNKESVDRNAEEIVKKAEKDFRKKEADEDKRVADYSVKVISSLSKDEDSEKFNMARGLVYHIIKEQKWTQ